MKYITFASIMAMLSIFTHAFAEDYYVCNGKRIPYDTIKLNVALCHKIVFGSGDRFFIRPSRDKTSTANFGYIFDYDTYNESWIVAEFDSSKKIISVQATISGEVYSCHAETIEQ
ncbi:BgTH12-02561 [Blumeria graminis f. sp. triticale]|uniref:BgtE-20007 n=3 Tax=Blumeria graminis TaxID=34373 RepID=A0A381LEK8_BLUGR|nr:BgTH12-02561 [Blumeria graminis f. sp. triticale]VDB88683.1 BgtE-20007 [Blumeria graminis f. sp. tritici]